MLKSESSHACTVLQYLCDDDWSDMRRLTCDRRDGVGFGLGGLCCLSGVTAEADSGG